jgi:hypothetical protein
VRQIFVCFDLADRSAFHVKTVKGRVHILPRACVSAITGLFWERVLTFSAMVVLQHLDIRVIREAVLAD